MAEEQRNRQLWLEAALIFAAWTVFGLILANQFYMHVRAARACGAWGHAPAARPVRGVPLGVRHPRHLLAGAALPARAGAHAPEHRGSPRGAVVLSLARVVVMVELSRQVEWLPERTFSRQFWGSSLQYLLFYALLLGIAHAVLYHGAIASASGPRSGWRPA
jgi:hypothetical protein